MPSDVAVYLGALCVIPKWTGIALGYTCGKLLVCPSCFNNVMLVRSGAQGPWQYDPWCQIDSVFPPKVKSERDFFSHVKICKSPFSRGINRIDRMTASATTAQIAEELAKWSLRDPDGSWKTQPLGALELLPANKFPKGIPARARALYASQDVVVYVYVNTAGPVSYAQFRKKQLHPGSKKKNFWAFWDFYTFPAFRRRGLAEQLVRKGITDLSISTSEIAISYPPSAAAKNLLRKIATGTVHCVDANQFFTTTIAQLQSRA